MHVCRRARSNLGATNTCGCNTSKREPDKLNKLWCTFMIKYHFKWDPLHLRDTITFNLKNSNEPQCFQQKIIFPIWSENCPFKLKMKGRRIKEKINDD